MRKSYPQFHDLERLPGEPFRPSTKRRRANRLFAFQLATGSVFAALLGWQAVPGAKAWSARADNRPERIAAAGQSVYYAGCNDARKAGAAPIYEGQPGYRQDMDGDHDGIACEPYTGSGGYDGRVRARLKQRPFSTTNVR